MNLSDRVRLRREALGLSQEELAVRMGYSSRSSINKIENGRPCSQKIIVRLAEALHTTPAFLMGWEEVEKKNDKLASFIVRMRTDEDFLSVVETLYELDADKVSGVKQMLNALLK